MELKFERESLYREVWATPMTALAKKYSLSDNGLRKVCAALAIPLPQRGHWAKVAAGHHVVMPTLPPGEGRTFFICRLPDTDVVTPPARQRDIRFQEQLAFEQAPENVITVPSELTSAHRLVATALKEAEKERAALHRSLDRINNPPKLKPGQRWEPDWEALQNPSWHSYEDRGRVMDMASGTLPLRVSIESIDRTMRIWDALLKACESRGMLVSSGYRLAKVIIGADHVGIRLSEIVDLIKPKTNARVYQPTVRRATGRLRIVVVDASDTKFDDTAHRPLEAQLNDVMACIRRRFALQSVRREQAAERRRRDEEAALIRERQRKAEAEAAQHREEDLRRQQAEQAAAAERERLLLAEAASWHDAETIRSYATHLKSAAKVEDAAPAPLLRDWLAWADAVADKLDPTSKRLLGTGL
jgi:hypothetical protein